MNTKEQYIRYPSGFSEEKLAKRFGLYWDNTMQDWELVVSDFGRIKDFIKVYQTELNNDDDKFTLMGLIVSSFDDHISDFDKETEENWNICKTILEKECYLHYSIIKYWSLPDEKDINNVFSITPYIREVWGNVKIKFT
ncbi:hypothetical protein ATE84_0075 [Aquimarina sp. MAR_2010_214]|uniref:hypothetical protein n=1 Tax=Aquimarina sp. MAR_2010_214 TaxID=1250026 RepID=UPI000C6FD60C|nr:hypothetical protein [Aquimarina sp. MAR_2010_214]PKV48089.1 hypothetical protein ATE84_0075 [Aquimarina sp. MAR_2010_214]